MNLYAVYIIKEYLKKTDYDDNSLNLITQQITTEYLLIFTSLLNKGNKKLSYEILIILINITYTKQGEILFGEDEKVIKNISTFLVNNKNDVKLLYLGIFLIKHITYKNPLVKQILQNYKIISFFEEIYEKYILDSNFMENLIKCLGHFIDSRFDKNKNILCSIKIIKSQLNKNTPIDLLEKYVHILYNLCFYKDPVIIKKMIDEDIYKILINIFPFDDNIISKLNINQNMNLKYINDEDFYDIEIAKKILRQLRLLILKILGNLFSLEEVLYTQKIIDYNISIFLNKVLKFTDIKIIKNAFYCISNICLGSYGQISNLYNNNTIIIALNVAKNIYETIISKNQFINNLLKEDFICALREIDYSFSYLIINSLFEKLIPIIKYDNYIIIHLLLKGIQLFEDNYQEKKLLSFILKAISKLLQYEKSNEDDTKEENINLIDLLGKNGFKEILEKLQTNSDEDIVDDAEKIFDEFFDDNNNENNLDNIDINDIIKDIQEEEEE